MGRSRSGHHVKAAAGPARPACGQGPRGCKSAAMGRCGSRESVSNGGPLSVATGGQEPWTSASACPYFPSPKSVWMASPRQSPFHSTEGRVIRLAGGCHPRRGRCTPGTRGGSRHHTHFGLRHKLTVGPRPARLLTRDRFPRSAPSSCPNLWATRATGDSSTVRRQTRSYVARRGPGGLAGARRRPISPNHNEGCSMKIIAA